MIDIIDRVIKEVWIKDINNDYNNNFLLLEDSLKNAFYYHLRNKLNTFFLDKNIRIYTELRTCFNEKSDIAIVRISNNDELHLSERIVEVLAIIELKYKGESVSVDPFLSDINKIKKYMKHKEYRNCQFYLGFIHETEYFLEETSWLTTRAQNSWAQGSLTELSAFYNEGKFIFTVLSYNSINEDLNNGVV